jgi:hypothetical protein
LPRKGKGERIKARGLRETLALTLSLTRMKEGSSDKKYF